MGTPIWILDISHHQAGIDVAAAVGEGFSAVICKATEGTTYADSSFDTFIPAAQRAGAIPGGYHFARSTSGTKQARAFHARLAAHGGPEGFLCALDNESDATWSVTKDFVAEWASLTNGHPLLMYSGSWWWSPRGWDGASLTPYLWTSHYVSGTGYASSLYTKVPESWWSPGYGGWDTATMLQFTSSAKVAGRSVDASAYLGSLSDLRKLTTTKETDVELSDTISGTTTDDHSGDRTVAEILGDAWWMLGHGRTLGGDTVGVGSYADSPLGTATVTLTSEQLAEVARQCVDTVNANLQTAISAALREVFGAMDET